MAIAYIALGSNLVHPIQQVTTAMDEIAAIPHVQLTKRSSLYATAPVGYDNQPDFINAVVEVETTLSPLALLEALFVIEDAHGRQRPFPNAPRVLDLDLLMHDNVSMQTERLTLPHPRMHARGFVMLPLAEIAPELMVQAHGSASALASQCQDQGVEKLASAPSSEH